MSRSKPRLLDLFCKAGGCTKGYQRAGFHVVGVDHEPQPNYCGDEFFQMDALRVLRNDRDWPCGGGDVPPEVYNDWAMEWERVRLDRFDAVHASPPCHAYSTVTQRGGAVDRSEYPDLVEPVRDLLRATGLPYVIENVVGAPLLNPIMLCGSSFGLDVRRHRLFESNLPIMAPPCAHGQQRARFRSLDSRQKTLATVIGVHGHLNYPGELELRRVAMGIDWMTNAEITQAIPPAYTEHIGHYLLAEINAREALAA